MNTEFTNDGRGGLPEPTGEGQTPEQQELDLKRAELRRLHDEAVAREMKVETLQAQLEGFAAERLFRLGRLYARIDELGLQIAEFLLARSPDDAVLQRRVQEARARLDESSEAAADAEERGPPRTVTLTPQLKKLYRDAARRVHPDLSRTPEEQEFRHAFMVRLNAAYTAGDIEGIQDVMASWDAQTDPPGELGVAEDLIRVIRSIAQYRRTLERLRQKIATLRTRSDHALMIRVHRAEAEGVDLLAEMEEKLAGRVAELEARLRDLEEGAAA